MNPNAARMESLTTESRMTMGNVPDQALLHIARVRGKQCQKAVVGQFEIGDQAADFRRLAASRAIAPVMAST